MVAVNLPNKNTMQQCFCCKGALVGRVSGLCCFLRLSTACAAFAIAFGAMTTGDGAYIVANFNTLKSIPFGGTGLSAASFIVIYAITMGDPNTSRCITVFSGVRKHILTIKNLILATYPNYYFAHSEFFAIVALNWKRKSAESSPKAASFSWKVSRIQDTLNQTPYSFRSDQGGLR